MGPYLKSWHRAEDGPCVRCYACRLVEAVFVGLLLLALAAAWGAQHLALWPDRSADSAVSTPVSQSTRDAACPNNGVDAIGANHHGGAVVTAC